MARTSDLFQILRSNIDILEEENNSTLINDVRLFLSETFLGQDFERIGVLDPGSDEANIYRELGAIPEARYRWLS